ncbi:hypothetical protein A8F57_10905 [Burkholderia cenocepacia]|nr:hypothetical protein A8F54_16085 [Burkholderia cenocepacia]OOA45992.1 hypothetical protein A8F57_10905 [Burkholderia cenocepacia]OOA72817.1 hypothetical protein A8F63_12760 [Burkholderia cenocepacia]OOB55938.1 hypothetical protein A8F71_11880 [Burkholderia cenocepacia]
MAEEAVAGFAADRFDRAGDAEQQQLTPLRHRSGRHRDGLGAEPFRDVSIKVTNTAIAAVRLSHSLEHAYSLGM